MAPQVQPAFGEADLSNCEREQIQFAASIQPHGALLLVSEPDLVIQQVSANVEAVLDIAGPVLGQSLIDIGDLAERIRPHLDDELHAIPVSTHCRVGANVFDCLLHRPAGAGLIIELQRAGPAQGLLPQIAAASRAIAAAASLPLLCDEAAKIFHRLTGYDRVMVYRFDDAGHGEVFSEQRRPELEAYLGNRYPASDIPQVARRLYERNRVRVLVDVGYEPVPLDPRHSPMTGTDLDMSLCSLRSMSPLHTQYLKNMGVTATLVISLLVGGRLWGLIACHHYRKRNVPFEIRAICELLAEVVGTRIAALESFLLAQAELSVRRLEQRMVEAISRDGDWRVALFDNPQSLLQPVSATGVALVLDGQILTGGDVPSTQHIRSIGSWLQTQDRKPVAATSALEDDVPDLAALSPDVSGLLATPLSSSSGDYLIWFRPERVRTIVWGGDPFKPVIVGDDPRQLSPRRSFTQWHQLVQRTSEPWSQADLTAARMIGETVADVILQFRAVHMLIVQDQLDLVRRQVQGSDQPVIVTDPYGDVLVTNAAFDSLLPSTRARPTKMDHLASLFMEADIVRTSLRDLLERRRPWRSELHVKTAGETKSLLMRADPVFSSPDRVIGFVLLLLDNTDRETAERARRRFQDGIIDTGIGTLSAQRGAGTDPNVQQILSAIVDNARAAALEITDGLDMARMPDMLESVGASVSRSSQVLDHLMRYARGEDNDGPDTRL